MPPWWNYGAWTDLARGAAYLDVSTVEDKVLAARPGTKAVEAAPESAWDIAHARVQDGMRTIATEAAVADRADPFGRALFTPAGAAVLFGHAAGIASQRPGHRAQETSRGHAPAPGR